MAPSRRDVVVATVGAAIGGGVVAGLFAVWSSLRNCESPVEQSGCWSGKSPRDEHSIRNVLLTWLNGQLRRLPLATDEDDEDAQSEVKVKAAITEASNDRTVLDHFNPAKREGYLSWDDYFMAIAFLSAQRSKDPKRQVGACIVSQDQIILGIGYNGFPRGCSDDKLPWAKMSEDGDPLKTKYPYVCHAEVNAILNRNHASAAGQRLFVTMFPCNECAKMIIQARIAEVVYFTEKGQGKNKNPQDFSFVASKKLLAMAGIKVWQYKPGTQALLLEYR